MNRVSNGFGQLLPHTALRLDFNGDPTTEIIDLDTVEDILATRSLIDPS